MTRQEMIAQLESHSGKWDICIIGGGATGLGAAVDAASRGFKTILLEQYDFAKATSSRSTKLVHGGVRYLQQGNIKLVLEALKERGILKNNAPHLVKNQSFIVPNYKWWEGPFYGIGLKVYDWMSGRLGLGPSQFLTKEETLEKAPTLDADGLRGSVLYHDGQFDDARLAINLAATAAENGCTLINYCKATNLIKQDNLVTGVHARDILNEIDYTIKAKAVINASGVFTDFVLKMDDEQNEDIIAPSQGVHIVLDKEFLPGDAAIMVPHTDDGRVLFAVPWHNKIIIGTTDTPIDEHQEKLLAEPIALDEEIDFILHQISKYLTHTPTRKNIKSVFAGLRPLVKGSSKKTAELSRDHLITVSGSGLITITGGKWTTYRRMAEDVVNTAIKKANLENKACITESLKIHGAKQITDFNKALYYYGSDKEKIKSLIEKNNSLSELIHPNLAYVKAEVVWAVQNEMCMTVEDFLARRTRALLLDANAAIECAPAVASLMSKEMNKEETWAAKQVAAFKEVAGNYLPKHVS
ncbi:MAG: glycerol-3-phosphate dehydrogenase/oxidase [Bacteroidetes bacterium]|nr:glycerol-3-phosphate dehydrogenase/oxidase [Bacteroidota bacterium]MBS1973016.1 glycerol-3-phosphate dehydrogenase/oxidase [Bacteroidota bacterium]